MKAFPCSCCKHPVKINQKALLCTACNNWIHISCGGIPKNVYDDESEHFVNWQCRTCIFRLLPFNDLETVEFNNSFTVKHPSVKDKPVKIVNPTKSNISGKGLKFAHLNVVSLVKYVDEVKLYLLENDVDVLALNETRLDESIYETENQYLCTM